MISKGSNKKAAEKRWHETVAEWSKESLWLNQFNTTCRLPYVFELDHIIGAQAKRKVNLVSTKVGEWAVIAIPYEIHNVKSGHPLNRTLKPSEFRKRFGHEKQLFKEMIEAMKQDGIEIPFSDEILNAIVYG